MRIEDLKWLENRHERKRLTHPHIFDTERNRVLAIIKRDYELDYQLYWRTPDGGKWENAPDAVYVDDLALACILLRCIPVPWDRRPDFGESNYPWE
jgi:hypothetical protein